MTFTTGNTERDAMLRRAIGECQALRETPSFGLVAEKLPDNFELDAEEELAPMLADMNLAPARVIQPVTALVIQPEPEPQPAAREYILDANTPAEAAAIMPKIAEAEARRQLDEARAVLDKAKDRLVNARINLRQKRDNLSSAAYAWQMLADNLATGISPEVRRQIEVRNHLAATAAERAARRGPNNSANAFVMKSMRGGGPNRGAYSNAARTRAGFVNHDPSRGPVQKLPSER